MKPHTHTGPRGGTAKRLAAVMDFYVDKHLRFWRGVGFWGTTVEGGDSGSRSGCSASSAALPLSALSALIALVKLLGHPFLMFGKKIMENTI